ncbi:MAG: nitrite reductase small subunit NirD [Burkholderiales bacterium]|nr:nitrite reductase small subunit NirD [Burkholderiales bacterium]
MLEEPLPWTTVCQLGDILPDTGVCARLGAAHVAIFRLTGDRLFAIDNVDPKSGVSVLARGLVGNMGERFVVASPLYKNHIDLATGEGVEDTALSVATWPVRLQGGAVQVLAR